MAPVKKKRSVLCRDRSFLVQRTKSYLVRCYILALDDVTPSAKCQLDQRRLCNIFSLENETESAIHIFSYDVDVTLFLKNQQQFCDI